MDTKITIFPSLYQTYQTMGLPVAGIDTVADFTIDNLKELHPVLPFKSIGFRPNYFSFLFVKNARGQYTTDDITLQTEPGTIYFTNPGHFKSFAWYELEEVWLITFTETFLKKNIHADIFKEFPFLLAETVYPRVLSEEDFAEFESLYLLILKEYRAASAYKSKMIGNLLVVILLKIKEYFWNDYKQYGTAPSKI